MWFTDEIADAFEWIRDRFYAVANAADNFPYLGGVFSTPFRDIGGWFDLSAYNTRETGNVIDGIRTTISDFLSWDQISDRIIETFTEIKDFWDNVHQGVQDVISDQYSVIKDFWGNVYQGAEDLISDKYSQIKDFWGNIRIGIKDWAETDLLQWLEDRAEKVISLAARILDKVW